MKPYFLFSGLMVGGALLTVASVQASASAPEMTPFHTQAQAVDSHYYLPPPPKDGSPALTYDKAAYQEGYAMKGTPRWQQATQDANLHVDNMAKIFSPVLGVTISASKTPATWSMLQNLLIMGGDYAPDAAKKFYMRTRPFVVFHHHTCQPADEAVLRKNGSYPSGHTSYGTLLALVLSEAKPERAKELAKRGYEFGQSRVICGAHWQSDVNAGRYVGAMEYARLQTVPAFIEQAKQVKAELNSAAAE
jgi:acid phosphatase (class A)